MNQSHYLEKVKYCLETYFDIEQEGRIGTIPIDLMASYQMRVGRTFISKVDIIDEYHDYEMHYIKHFSQGTGKIIKDYMENIEKEVMKRKLPEYHHSSSYIIVMICNKIDEEAKKLIKAYERRKSHCCGLKGWTDLRGIYIELDTKELYIPKDIKHVEKVYAF